MIAEPNAISHGLTTALTGGLTRGGRVFAVISAAKPGTAVQVRASVAANAIFFLGLRSFGTICAIRSTAALAVRSRVLLIISLLSRWPTTGPNRPQIAPLRQQKRAYGFMSVAFPTHSARMQAVCRAYNSAQYFDCSEGGVFSRPRALPEPRTLPE